MDTVTAFDAAPIRMLAVSGSLRGDSYNTMLLRAAQRLAPEGIEFTEFDTLGQVEPYDGDAEDSALGMPPGAAAFARALRQHDAVLIATPEYNGSVPGQLKNALDWASRADGAAPAGSVDGLPSSPLYGVPVAVMSASTGQFGAVWARDELAKVLRTQGARPITEPGVSLPQAHRAFDDDALPSSPAVREQIVDLLRAVADVALRLRAAAATQATLVQQ